MSRSRFAFYVILLLCLYALPGHAHANTRNLQLPSLGETSAGLISLTEEYELGQALIRHYRGALPLSQDPFVDIYLDTLLQRLAAHSELQDKRLERVVLDNPTLNAFAAPGGIVGVNLGTFLSAQNEHQLSSILAHELAHLSQRHYARRVQQQKTTGAVSMAALLAAIAVAVAGNGDLGIAAMPAIQAASIQSSLAFSRDMELEADRLAFQTLVRAGFDPYAVQSMFEQMLRATRHRSRVPEFLLSHPVTETRIADAANRAQRHPRRQIPLDPEYQLLRARVLLHYESNSASAIKRFRDEVETGQSLPTQAAHYGLVLALTRHGDTQAAREALTPLKAEGLHPVYIAVAEADIAAKDNQWPEAVRVLRSALAERPGNHPLSQRLAEILMESGQYADCEALLKEHVQRHPTNTYLWYLLAEVHGLAGNILDVHRARAEYFMLNGIYNKAEIQLRNALRLIDEKDFQARARIEQRLLDLRKLQQNALY